MGVRRVRAGEWRDLRSIRLRALEESPESFGSSATEARQRGDEEWRAWAAAAAASQSSAVFVAADGPGRGLVGLCGSFLLEEDPEVARIVAMWVEPDQRGRRLGERLLDAAAEWSARRGARELVLDVTETNEAARRLYRRMGFCETGGRAPLRSNPHLLTVEMRKPLGVTAVAPEPNRY